MTEPTSPRQMQTAPLPARTEARSVPKVSLAMTDEGRLKMVASGDWSAFAEATAAPEIRDWMAKQLSLLGEHGLHISEAVTNGALAFVSEMRPRDPAELLLLTQMAAVHHTTMTLAKRLSQAETIPQQDAAERAFNKLARTYAGQMETLKRYRSKGTQVVRVERVTVESGGQAVVGHVETGGRDRGEGRP